MMFTSIAIKHSNKQQQQKKDQMKFLCALFNILIS